MRAAASPEGRGSSHAVLGRAHERILALLQAAPDALLVVDAKGRINGANQQAAVVFGHSPQALLGRPVEDLMPERFRAAHVRHRARFSNHPSRRPMGPDLELRGLRGDGHEFPLEIILSPIETPSGPQVIAAVRDVTQKNLGEEALARLASVVQSSPDGIVSVDLENAIVAWNPGAEKMFGYSEEEALGKSIAMLQRPDGDEASEAEVIQVVRRGEAVEAREVQRVRKDGTMLWVSVAYAPVYDRTGRIIGVTTIKRDVTLRRQSDARLAASLQEKDGMLQEIHHRVKNNLQVVASLLSLQGQYAGDERTHELFQASRHRVRSISLVHEKLYRSKDLAKINLQDYLPDLVGELRRLYSDRMAVAVALDVEPVMVGPDAAINCGLIVTELVSNALKHAFPDGRGGTVRVTVAPGKTAGTIILRVADDGVGMEGPFPPPHASTLGLRLVATLVQQLQGTIERMDGPGTQLQAELRIEPMEKG